MSKRWGTPTWLFFHIYVEKISPEYYNSNHKKCINIIKLICNNLPCPYCREDAVKYITKTNPIDNMITRDLLRVYLFNFHNWVNKKLNKPIFLSEKLEKYKKGVFINAYKYFCQEFYKPDYVSKHFSQWRRNKMKDTLEKEIKEMYKHFYY